MLNAARLPKKGRAEVIDQFNLFFSSHPPFRHQSVRPTIQYIQRGPCIDSLRAGCCFLLHLVHFRCRAAPPLTVCQSAQSALRCGCLVPKGTTGQPQAPAFTRRQWRLAWCDPAMVLGRSILSGCLLGLGLSLACSSQVLVLF